MVKCFGTWIQNIDSLNLDFALQTEATGGNVHETDKENIGKVLKTVIGETFPSTEIIIDSFDWSASETIDKNITIDSTITVLKISVTGSSAETDVDIYHANGETIISIQQPPGGIMNLRRNVISDWKVKITSQSSIKVDGELLEKSDTGEMVSLKGSPISDNNYTVELFVYSLGLNGTCHTIALTDSTGNVISSHEASQLKRDFDTLCAATFRMPYVEFQVKLYGNDDSGRPFTRKLSEIHKPCSVELSIKGSTDDVILGKKRLIGYEIKNRGTVPETYQVSISDDHSFAYGTTVEEYTLSSGDGANGTFAVKPTTPSVIFSYTISVLIVSTGKIQQSITKKLVVTDVERPDCTVVHTDEVCGISSLNTANCSLYPWTALAEVTFSGTLLDSISSTVGMSVKLSHVNITGLSTGPIAVNISGDCCTPSLYIYVIDIDGFISQCDLSFGDGQSVQSVEVVSGTDIYTIIIVMTACIAVVVVAVIIAFVLRMDQLRSKGALVRSKVILDTSTNEKFNSERISKQQGLAIIEQ
ncbi:unnamed protein product [Mytilus edulis]|uniref:Uncharacterized protein n=1 Tax=Mytilus edulis TaxID=6550 RepID=A0A8S3VLA7_MYTED|nr:unnamed protein product [Mytilus edulis]